MKNFLIEKFIKKSKTASNKLASKRPDEDFLPYVCHFDKNTILTKNGELLQIIRITGFSNSSVISEIISLRETVRDAILEYVQDNKVALWFNTIRRKKNIAPKGDFSDFFAQKFNEAWIEDNKWNDQYVNELYITIIVEGFDTSIVNINSFARSFSYAATKSLHHKFLLEAHKKLTKITQNIVNQTEGYGAKLLGISEWDGVLYSEPMRFFGKIVNLCEDRYPLAANDISSDLASHKIAFGDRELEVIGDKNKNFAAVLSLKEYFEVSTSSLDRILQLPFEFIITQSFDFTFSKKELEAQEYQNYILKVSGDEDFRQMIGIANFVENATDSLTDFGKLQTTVTIINKNTDALEKDVKRALDQFSALGFVLIREDIFLEHCFWSQLPGNFRYLRRQKIINTSRVAGFAALHNFPSGSISGRKWKSAVTVLKTVLNTPYFFNFHEGDLGHTVVLGSQKSGKTVLINFLLAQLQKVQNKLFYLDFNNSSKCFIRAISGHYYEILDKENEGAKNLKINPFSLPKTSENQNFLNDFFVNLVSFSKLPNLKNEIKFIPQIVERILISDNSDFKSAIEFFNSSETKNIYLELKNLNTQFGSIFSSETLDWSSSIMGFDLTQIYQAPNLLISIASYLLHCIEIKLNGSPSVIVLDNAWNLLEGSVLATKIGDFLERLKQKNCIVIFVSKATENLEKSEISAEIKKNIATEIFMPDENPHSLLKTVFGLNDEEFEIVKMMSDKNHTFLFKNNEDAVISSLNFSKLVEFLKIFSCDELTQTAMQEVIETNSSEENPNPETKIWLPQLFEVLKEIEKERVATEKKMMLEAAAAERKRLKIRFES
jgi:type IV secretion system protein VirB4